MALVKLGYSLSVMPPRDPGAQLLFDEGWSKEVFTGKKKPSAPKYSRALAL